MNVVTLQSLAKYLGVSYPTVYRLSRKGAIPGMYRVERQVFFMREPVINWIREGGMI